jgi:hypothetical protein
MEAGATRQIGVEAAATSGPGVVSKQCGGARSRRAWPHTSRQHGGGGRTRPGSTMEADRSERGRGGEFYFFGRVRTRGSEDIASGGDAFVHRDARVESLSNIERATLLTFYASMPAYKCFAKHLSTKLGFQKMIKLPSL